MFQCGPEPDKVLASIRLDDGRHLAVFKKDPPGQAELVIEQEDSGGTLERWKRLKIADEASVMKRFEQLCYSPDVVSTCNGRRRLTASRRSPAHSLSQRSFSIMPPEGTGTGLQFDPVAVVRALETHLNKAFNAANKFEIANAGKYFIVRDLHDGIFNVTQIDGKGGVPITTTDAIKVLPCDNLYLGLVLTEWTAMRR